MAKACRSSLCTTTRGITFDYDKQRTKSKVWRTGILRYPLSLQYGVGSGFGSRRRRDKSSTYVCDD